MMTTDQHSPAARPLHLRRWLPVLALLLLAALGYGLGLHRYLSLATLAEHRDGLRAWVEGNLALALAAYMLLYVAVVALSIPGAGVMSLAGGFLFGTWIGGSLKRTPLFAAFSKRAISP